MASNIINNLNEFGRVSSCGAISNYNDAIPPKVPATSASIVFKVKATKNLKKSLKNFCEILEKN